VLEGKTEMLLMPKVLAELYGEPVPPTLIEPVLMDTIDRDLDLLVRHVIGPRLGQVHGDVVVLARPPTRILIAVDPEKRFATPVLQEQERKKLVRRLHEALPIQHQTADSLAEINTLVEVTTWGTLPWEFANFTDGELASGIIATGLLPAGTRWQDVRIRVKIQRASRRPDITLVTGPWHRKVGKVRLAEQLWPRLKTKVHSRSAAGTLTSLPATRVALRALETAIQTHRRRVAMKVK
jgi:hypothetical protein